MLALKQRFKIIKRLKKFASATILAHIYGVGKITVNDIKYDAEKIEQLVSKCRTPMEILKLIKT